MSNKDKNNNEELFFDEDINKIFEEESLFDDEEESLFDNEEKESSFDDEEKESLFDDEEKESLFDDKEKESLIEEEIEYNENPNNREELFNENTNNQKELSNNKNEKKIEKEDFSDDILINKEKKDNSIRNIVVSMMVTAIVSIGASFGLINYVNNDKNDFIEFKNDLDIQKGIIVKLQNDSIKLKSTIENSELIKENITKDFNEIKESLSKEMENKLNNKKYFEILLAANKKNIDDISEIKEKISNLPISTGEIEKRFVSLEKEIKSNGTNKSITIELASLKEQIEKQKNEITEITNKRRKDEAELTKIRYAYNELNEKTMKNAQYIAENRKAVKNNSNRINGENDVKELLEQVQTSKEVRAVSLLFDKDRMINIEKEKKGYKIIGSIASEVVFIDNGNDDHSTYGIGDYLDGYGKILKIGDNGTIETENGIVKNLNNMD